MWPQGGSVFSCIFFFYINMFINCSVLIAVNDLFVFITIRFHSLACFLNVSLNPFCTKKLALKALGVLLQYWQHIFLHIVFWTFSALSLHYSVNTHYCDFVNAWLAELGGNQRLLSSVRAYSEDLCELMYCSSYKRAFFKRNAFSKIKLIFFF